MDLDLAQLRAQDATVRGGTLEAAAREFHVTPSAISQRLRALEVATGRILLVRTKPVQVTESGQAVLRPARQVDVLAADIARGGDGSPEHVPTLPIAVNADSMTSRVLPALSPLAGEVLHWQQWRLRSPHSTASARPCWPPPGDSSSGAHAASMALAAARAVPGPPHVADRGPRALGEDGATIFVRRFGTAAEVCPRCGRWAALRHAYPPPWRMLDRSGSGAAERTRPPASRQTAAGRTSPSSTDGPRRRSRREAV